MRCALVSMLVLLAGCLGAHLPEDFEAPDGLETSLFEIERLQEKDARNVYEAVVASRELIREVMPEDAWPRRGMTFENQLQEIERRRRHFEAGKCFCYTIKAQGTDRVIGGVLVEPKRGGQAAAAYYWVRPEEQQQGSEPLIDRMLRTWLDEDWNFERVDFPGRTPLAWAQHR